MAWLTRAPSLRPPAGRGAVAVGSSTPATTGAMVVYLTEIVPARLRRHRLLPGLQPGHRHLRRSDAGHRHRADPTGPATRRCRARGCRWRPCWGWRRRSLSGRMKRFAGAQDAVKGVGALHPGDPHAVGAVPALAPEPLPGGVVELPLPGGDGFQVAPVGDGDLRPRRLPPLPAPSILLVRRRAAA